MKLFIAVYLLFLLDCIDHNVSGRKSLRFGSFSVMSCSICNVDLHNGQPTVRLGQKGVETLNNVLDGKKIFQVGQNVHVDCRRDYCRDAKRNNRDPSSPVVTSPVKTRSSLSQPRWNEDCFFCGNPAKYDGRKRGYDVIPVRTEVLLNSITDICKERKDAWATVVLGRLEYARDLHAADAVYHRQCSVNFRTGEQIPRQHTNSPTDNPTKQTRHSGRPKNTLKTDAFLKVVEWLESNDEEQTTVNDLCVKMKEYLQETEEEAYSPVYMKSKVIEHLGERILITTVEGKPNVVTFQRTAASIINEFFCTPKQADVQTEKERIVAAAAQLLKSEIKGLQVEKDTYPSPEDIKSIDKAFEFIPNLLSSFLKSIFAGKAADVKIAALAQAIMQATRPRVMMAPLQLGLGVQMHHHFASRFLIDTLNPMGFCSSYSTIHKFERSAAVAQGTEIPGYTPGSFVQFVADNVDHNSRTLDGSGTFHGMGMIASITPATRFRKAIPIKSVTATDIASAGKVTIRQYQGPNEDATSLVYKTLKDLKVRDPTSNLDLLYKVTQPLFKSPRPAWSGAMQMFHKKGDHPGQSSVMFLPMIDMDPSDMTCIYSTLSFIADQANRYNITPIITFDQPLWWKALMIVRNEPEDSKVKSIVLKLGGLHIQMSFLGCIGHIMAGSGLEDILELIYAKNAVPHMLSGKAIARAIRGHFLLDSALNCLLMREVFNLNLEDRSLTVLSTDPEDDAEQQHDNEDNVANRCHQQQVSEHRVDTDGTGETEETVQEIRSQPLDEELQQANSLCKQLLKDEVTIEEVCSADILNELSQKIEDKKTAMQKQRTSLLWMQYMKMIDILRLFIKAERTGNWNLHLQALYEMLPYFAAAGHNLYAKSAYVYLQMMQELQVKHLDVYNDFQRGLHVVRRSDRYWAGLSADLIIEQVLMRSVKTSGGLTRGRGFTETQRLVWLLSMPACAEVNIALQTLTGSDYETSEQHTHKDSSFARQQRDYKEIALIIAYLNEKNPFSPDTSLRNIVTGVVAEEKVDADTAKEVGVKIISSMVDKNVLEFSFTRKNEVISLASKNAVTFSDGKVQVDPQLLFQRLSIVATCGRFDNSKELFKYEMCSFPPALFESSQLPRQANKPVLANAIWEISKEQQTTRPSGDVHYVLDGGSLLHHLPWPRGSTYEDVLDRSVNFVIRKYGKATIVFDGYEDGPSTKDCTHRRRTGSAASQAIHFNMNMTIQPKKQEFLSNKVNKQAFIRLLTNKLQIAGCSVKNAQGDADVLIALTAVESARIKSTALVGEDTDLLVLLCYHADLNGHDLFFVPEPKKTSISRRIWNIRQTKRALGENVCKHILFLHAILGCDTTSRVHGLGKAVALKKFQKNMIFRQHAEVFMNQDSTKEDIAVAGEMALVCLYGGTTNDDLDALRFTRFCQKVATGSSFLQPQNLPPTSSAAAYHSQRVFFQVQEWKGETNLQPIEWGWKLSDGKLLPVMTDMPPAHKSLLEMIRCNCKADCKTMRCTCRKHGLDCSPACGVCKGDSCSNTAPLDIQDD